MAVNFLNGLPVIGHAKGIIHYISGNIDEGNSAIYEATRSSIVIGSGIVGMVGGPGGAAACAIGAGALTDTVTSIITRKPKGLIKGIDNIATDIINKDNPMGSIAETCMYVGLDGVSALGTGGASQIVKFTGKSIAKSIVSATVKSEVMLVLSLRQMFDQSNVRYRLRRRYRSATTTTNTTTNNTNTSSRGNETSSNSTATASNNTTNTTTNNTNSSNSTRTASNNTQNESSTAGGASGDGSQPPRDNEKQNKKEQDAETNMSAFLTIFNVGSLSDVRIGGIYIFRNLQPGQIKTLKKLIKNLRLNGNLKQVTEIVVKLFENFFKEDVTFLNYLSLSNFVASYIGERAALYIESQRERTSVSFNDRRQFSFDTITESANITQDIYHEFERIRSQVESANAGIEPRFRDIYSAVYHFYKHRLNPHNGTEFSVESYFEWIDILLDEIKIMASNEYLELTNPDHPRTDLVYERYFTILGGRIRIVLKFHDGHLELSSCYILTTTFQGDEDGDAFIT